MDVVRNPLLVIDAQPKFEAYTEQISMAIWREVTQAMAQKRFILVVELTKQGWTDFSIIDALQRYDRFDVVRKNCNDATGALVDMGYNVVSKYVHPGIPTGFEVCGINRCCCVAETIQGLLEDQGDDFAWIKDLVVLDHAVACICAESDCFPLYLLENHEGRIRRTSKKGKEEYGAH